MKHRVLIVFFALAACIAVPVFGASSLLTPDGVRYTLEMNPELPHIQIARAEAGERVQLIVPSTQDAVRESQAQLAYDSATDTLFVVWVRENAGVGEVRYATLSPAGHWSPTRLVTAGSTSYHGLQVVLTHGTSEDGDATLMHAAWWSMNGNLLAPEYALFAFENGRLVSAQLENLVELAGLASSVDLAEFEITVGKAVHPPLVLDRDGETVDVAFGSSTTTSISRLNIVSRKVGGDVRIWKPLGRRGGRTPRTGLMSVGSAPVGAYMNDGHLALYTIGENFRFTVLRNNGTWSAVHTLRIDAENTAEDLLRELEKTVEELLEDEDSESEDEPAAASR